MRSDMAIVRWIFRGDRPRRSGINPRSRSPQAWKAGDCCGLWLSHALIYFPNAGIAFIFRVSTGYSFRETGMNLNGCTDIC
jgi:hypothetical protein